MSKALHGDELWNRAEASVRVARAHLERTPTVVSDLGTVATAYALLAIADRLAILEETINRRMR